MARLAWFSPMPPARTGVAVCSAELVAALGDEHEIDVFVDRAASPHGEAQTYHSAHDFLWMNRLAPYDLTVYQLGNSAAHEYTWPYLFRFPGLAVLHDAHVHHARAAALLVGGRTDDYRAEFTAAAPQASPDMAELAVAGFPSHLYYCWPMIRLVALASRLTAVHSARLSAIVRDEAPGALVDSIRLGHGEPVDEPRACLAAARIRARHGIPPSSVLFGVHGGLTPEKRVPQVLSAWAALLPYVPDARLVLAGEPAAHYDVHADISRFGLGESVVVTGFIADEDDFTDYVAGCDVSINLRWPTAREVSGPWVRALAAGRATITTDLSHTADVPSLDPRTWTPPQSSTAAEPVTVSIDILDEDHSLRLALRRLATDAELRQRLGRAAAAYWRREHAPAHMIDDYRRAIARARATPAPSVDLPPHLRADGGQRLAQLLEPFGLGANVWSKI